MSDEVAKTATEAAPAKPVAPAQQPAAKPVQEKQTNCPACNKPIKKLKRYYRDGKFYCNKRCWAKIVKTKKEGEEEK